jgi:glycosyltransferase involved in cell wall biosynthesis
MQETRRKVLVFIDWYEPGYKAGGPIRSAVNFVSHFKDQIDIYVFTSDRDLGDAEPYKGIEQDRWLLRDDYRVFYSSPSFRNWKNISLLIQDVSPDTLYLNSMFSRYFAIYPLLMKKKGLINGRIVLAPRGMLRSSALRHKAFKKTVFLQSMKHLGMMAPVRFHATDEQEMTDIAAVFGKEVEIMKTGNLPGGQKPFLTAPEKTPGSLSMFFVGRIHPIKNLHYLLECLQDCKSKIKLTIAAPMEDEEYWEKCAKLISELPSNIEMMVLNDVSHDKIEAFMVNNHIFVLPTAGENFGHAIFEAFSAGRPALISDQTPWRELEKQHAGWDVALGDRSKFTRVIEEVASMGNEELNIWCEGAWQYCKNYLDSSHFRDDYIKLLF